MTSSQWRVQDGLSLWFSPAPLMRLAHLVRLAWHKVRRPVTMGTRAIVLDGHGRVLLLRHSYVGGWHLPGGGVDRGETVGQAVRREVREETGLQVGSGIRFLGLYARFRHGASDHVAVFVTQDWRGELSIDDAEIVEAAFFAIDALPEATTPATRRRLEEYLGRVPIDEYW
ncbi:MAG TPA: NUDIX domain-containing protein [Azospirillaceae bacterium]|nr:NUDIX domain-containing protein [Azospirillaceae bacterium]